MIMMARAKYQRDDRRLESVPKPTVRSVVLDIARVAEIKQGDAKIFCLEPDYCRLEFICLLCGGGRNI